MDLKLTILMVVIGLAFVYGFLFYQEPPYAAKLLPSAFGRPGGTINIGGALSRGTDCSGCGKTFFGNCKGECIGGSNCEAILPYSDCKSAGCAWIC